MREAAGASETVDVEVTVFDAGAEGHAPAVTIRADDVMTYLGRRLSRIRDALGRSEITFLEISDGDGDEVLVYARYTGNQSASEGWAFQSPGDRSTWWARRDVQGCFYSSSSLPPCPF